MFSVTKLCSIPWDPIDCSPSGSSVCGIFQARIPEYVAISSSRGSSWTHACTDRQIFLPLEPPGKPRFIPRSEIAWSHVQPFEELPKCFPTWLHHSSSSLAVCEGSNFTISSPTHYCMLFDYSYPNGCEVVLFWISLIVNDAEHFFTWLTGHGS